MRATAPASPTDPTKASSSLAAAREYAAPAARWLAPALLSLLILAGCGGSGAGRAQRVARALLGTSPRYPALPPAPSPRQPRSGPVAEVIGAGGRVLRRIVADFDRGPGSGSGGEIDSAVADGHGGWFVAGRFTGLGGVATDGIAHVLADGRVDPRWHARLAGASVTALAATPGVVYVAVEGPGRVAPSARGRITPSAPGRAAADAPGRAAPSARGRVGPSSPSGLPATRLVAFSAATGARQPAPAQPGAPITTMTVADGMLLVGLGSGSGSAVRGRSGVPSGSGSGLGSGSRSGSGSGSGSRRGHPSCLIAYRAATGKPDPQFHAGIQLPTSEDGSACVGTLVRSGQRLYVGGSFARVDGVRRPSLARLGLPSGALDRAWRPANHPGLDEDDIAVARGLFLFNAANGAIGALQASSGKLDPRWAWPPRRHGPDAGLGCCAAPTGVTGRLVLIAADSPEGLEAIRVPGEVLERYPRGGLDLPVRVAARSGGRVLAGFVGGA